MNGYRVLVSGCNPWVSCSVLIDLVFLHPVSVLSSVSVCLQYACSLLSLDATVVWVLFARMSLSATEVQIECLVQRRVVAQLGCCGRMANSERLNGSRFRYSTNHVSIKYQGGKVESWTSTYLFSLAIELLSVSMDWAAFWEILASYYYFSSL